MASMRDIKRRRGSIQSTQQITKAMKLVSTVKLQKARGRADAVHPYSTYMYQTVSSLLGKVQGVSSPYLTSGKEKRKAVIVISSNRGLAGGYNNAVVKLLAGDEKLSKDRVDIYAVGSKARDGLSRRGYQIVADYSDVMDGPTYEDGAKITEAVMKSFEDGEIGEIYLVYTYFKNTVVQIPTLVKLLPVDPDNLSEEGSEKAVRISETPMNFEPNEEEVLELLIPKYLTSLFYGAFIQAVASENGARMRAMDSATKNADDMISDLGLKYNRARQSSITQELTEIIAGAEAIS